MMKGKIKILINRWKIKYYGFLFFLLALGGIQISISCRRPGKDSTKMSDDVKRSTTKDSIFISNDTNSKVPSDNNIKEDTSKKVKLKVPGKVEIIVPDSVIEIEPQPEYGVEPGEFIEIEVPLDELPPIEK